jgi:hydroxymethylpyrimidine pyrophosphatase-like HAD family hydrolase
MARKYPKFLWSNPTNAKSDGPFIVHTQEPRFLAKPYFDEQRKFNSISILEMWDNTYGPFDREVQEVKEEIYNWFEHSGRSISIHPDDKVIWEISRLGYLKENKVEFTVDQAREIVRILFPTKPKTVYKTSSSYGFKHLLECISGSINKGNRKYCSNDTMIEAFKLEGFKQVMDGPNAFMNLSAKEVKTARTLFRG